MEKILLYNKAGRKVLVGLAKRRKAEREPFLRPVKGTVSNVSVKHNWHRDRRSIVWI